MSERVYRDVHPVLYRELVEHAEARGLTVNAWLEDLAIAYHSTHHADGSRRETKLEIPRGWQAQPDPVPVVAKSGRARPRRPSVPSGPRKHYLDDEKLAQEFRDLCTQGWTNARLGAHYKRAPQTMSNWRERLGIPAARSAEAQEAAIEEGRRRAEAAAADHLAIDNVLARSA